MNPDISTVDNLVWHQRRYATVGDVRPVIQKPSTGDPCNRCGVCCLTYPCAIGRLFFGVKKGECPALQWDARGSMCGLISNPEKYMPTRVRIKGASRVAAAAKFLLGSGVGCNFGTVAPSRAQAECERITSEQARQAWKTLGLLKEWEAECCSAGKKVWERNAGP
ncbi:MAG TPA: hypothetical protein VKC66_38630 [Xanthobacteraceae bacterium]|nr:hypothetical protein [Xanthobacteraceae bacterium]